MGIHQSQRPRALIHQRDEFICTAPDVPGYGLTGIVRTCHQHSGDEIAQEIFFAALEMERGTVDQRPSDRSSPLLEEAPFPALPTPS